VFECLHELKNVDLVERVLLLDLGELFDHVGQYF
jgi:hypothetical protein